MGAESLLCRSSSPHCSVSLPLATTNENCVRGQFRQITEQKSHFLQINPEDQPSLMTSARAALPWRMKGEPGMQRVIHAAAHFSASCLSPSQVCVDNVLKTMKENANKASSILLTAVPQISQMDWAQTIKTLKVSPRRLPSEEVAKADVDAFAISRRVGASYFFRCSH